MYALTYQNDFKRSLSNAYIIIDSNIIYDLTQNVDLASELLNTIVKSDIKGILTLDLCIYEFLKYCRDKDVKKRKIKFVRDIVEGGFGITILQYSEIISGADLLDTACKISKLEQNESMQLVDMMLLTLMYKFNYFNEKSFLLTKNVKDFNNSFIRPVTSVFGTRIENNKVFGTQKLFFNYHLANALN